MFERDGVWTFSILGVSVHVRELPRNNIAVFHQICEPIRQLVEPICRGRGYWNPEFKNWIVFETFKGTVLAELGQIAAAR
ncbi:hypothetical protein BJN34_00140 [Cupriavidus necator]|uniref:Uncharacterized protein n=1 Tax=Cupriavidus necator TaxID=106590 RepID=A0A1U9UIZ7_CUPNE|nr:hypothetical protein [Cupriavidus necator]AQV92301.1 hypothetical protein BJN34_00140 [Cupriavidus necator]